MKDLFQEKHQDDILGTNSTFDRVIIAGSILPIAYQKGLSTFLSVNNILLKEFIAYAKNLADNIKEHAKSIAIKKNVSYIYLNSSKTRKEKIIKSIIKDRGNHPGLIAVLS